MTAQPKRTRSTAPAATAPTPSVSFTISPAIARRFVLGRSGLWPGRRWRGDDGIVAAVEAIGGVQIDPLLVTARNHDLKLFSRVIGYAPEQLDRLAYTERRFFDYGGLLFLYPMAELPHWRLHMARHRDGEVDGWWPKYLTENATLLDAVRAAVRERGPLGHRDLEGSARVDSYRARKDTGLALYALWRIGELMTSGRRRFDRLYDLTERVVPAAWLHTSPPDAAEAFFARKALVVYGLATVPEWRGHYAYCTWRTVTTADARLRLDQLVAEGTAARIAIEGRREPYFMLAEDLPLLEALVAGRLPDAWAPLEADTQQEVTFLAPLDPVSARGRATRLFDGYEYKWEVYTPAPKRRWGYYVLPILYGDQLVARADVKLDRPTHTLRVLNFLLEDPALGSDSAFAAALARGLGRFAREVGAERLDLGGIAPAGLRKARLYKGSGVTLAPLHP